MLDALPWQSSAVPPGNRLEKLARARKGQRSIRINDRWRACFRWENGDAHDEHADVHAIIVRPAAETSHHFA